ncbi:hypothetical protein HB364_06685 [Pseudoflavitalea sp. X16]|uniref:hypothetical protein n=1 Tax=Paraflavitalea devenefica TaxID=2716334 RepID=UPI0014206A8B|nr:hypothetical protein [Paraflavitalea devenefica]NII24755.1 hypothetical protein [Paraflavitalea devenefica]
MNKKFLLIAIIFISSFIAYSQTQNSLSKDSWVVERTVSNNRKSDGGFSKAIVRFNDRSIAVCTRYSKGDCGVVKINAEGKILWEAPVKGFVIALSKMDDRIIAFYSPEWKNVFDEHVIKKIYAVSISAEKGTIIEEKEIFSNATENFIDVKINTNPDETLSHLLVRYTDYKGNRFLSVNTKYSNLRATNNLELISVNKDLSVSVQKLNSGSIGGAFLTCTTMQDGCVVVISENEGTLIAEKFRQANPAPVSKITTNANFINRGDIDAYLCADLKDQDKLYLSFHCRELKQGKVLKVFGIDWKAQKIFTNKIGLDKDFKELLEQQNGKLSKGIRKHTDDIYPIGLLSSGDKIVLINQVYYWNLPTKGAMVHFFEDIVLSVFNKQLENESNIVLPREIMTQYSRGQGVGAEIIGNKLYIMHSDFGGADFSEVNLSSFKVEKTYTVSRNIMPGEKEYIPGDALLWYYGDVLRPYYSGKDISKSWVDMMLKIIE